MFKRCMSHTYNTYTERNFFMSAISKMLLVYKKPNEINIVYLDPD